MTSTPHSITMYAIESGEPEIVAEFRWSATAGVTLTVVSSSEWGRIARIYYEDGIPNRKEMSVIPRTNGEEFMRALADSDLGSYCYLVVDSQ
ncbi:hypothetical protein ACWEPH_19240 [Nocardia beijingensis]